jgi:site-specific recombinase XerD
MLPKLYEDFLYSLKEAKRRDDDTIYAYRLNLREFNKYVFNDREDVTPEDIRKLFADDILIKWLRVKEKEGLKAASLNQRLSTLKSLYKWLEGRREISINILRGISLFKDTEKTEKDILTLEESIELLDRSEYLANENESYETLRDYFIAALFLSSGVRINELHLLNFNNLDLENNKLFLEARQTKGKSKFRTISIPEEIIEIYNKYLPYRLEKDKTANLEHKNALFLSQKNNRLSTDQIRRNLYKLMDNCNVRKVSPHALRHSYATNLLAGGATIEEVSQQLGHCNINTTMSFYVHQSDKDVSVHNPVFNRKQKQEVKEVKKESKVINKKDNVIQLKFA